MALARASQVARASAGLKGILVGGCPGITIVRSKIAFSSSTGSTANNSAACSNGVLSWMTELVLLDDDKVE